MPSCPLQIEQDFDPLGYNGAPEKTYSVTVPASTQNLVFSLDSQSNDGSVPDVYVRKGAAPTDSQYDYRQLGIASPWTYSIDNPDATSYYLRIVGGHSGCGYPQHVTGSGCYTTIPPAPSPSPCDELGRATRCYVNGYDRTRVHVTRLVRGEMRCLVADFNGAIPRSRTIASAVWRADTGYSTIMSNLRIEPSKRSVAVDLVANQSGYCAMRCDAILDNGETYAQRFQILVSGTPWFQEQDTLPAGPQVLRKP